MDAELRQGLVEFAVRLVEDGGTWIEANDLSAVQACRERGVPFVAGPSLNIYNHRALAMLIEDGLRRWVPGVEQGHALIGELRAALLADGVAMPELEVQVLGRPVLANAACAVLEGQCRRSNGGLYYRDYAEFRLMLRRLMSDPALRSEMGARGESYVTANYSWEQAAAQTSDLLLELTSGAAA